jgi:hypothetical protein
VTVYTRSRHAVGLSSYRGMRIVVLPSISRKYLDTVSHTLLSALHASRQGYDAVLVCNATSGSARE